MDATVSPPAIARVLWLGLIFHLVYIVSVFDCYFTSPVVHGMQQFHVSNDGSCGEAKRLVLIVGDGLRADLLFNVSPFPSIEGSPEIVAPYLRNIALERGAFGVSHTRVPTESRPGHVAIIAGMYEDVSAVTKGWKTNPVDFDSVFNQSSHTFSFGSPDILPMFSEGAVPNRVKTWCYTAADEDFTKDASELDVWVIDRLRDLFRNASTDATLDAELRADKTVFFLHLLGLDTTGHSYRPHSKEYLNNIHVVDDIVRETESLFSDFFGDEETSFVFTADHGMSNIGNHGDGHPDNTRTPLIAWGAGVRGPVPSSTFPNTHDEYSNAWNLSHLARQDVEQADIATFMAALLGINIPVNSVGVIPDIDVHSPGYMQSMEGAEGDKAKARAALVNAKVILEHYRVKHDLKASHTVLYRPFTGLMSRTNAKSAPGSSRLSQLEDLFVAEEYNRVRERAAVLIDLTLKGLRYLQTYDRAMLCDIVFFGYLGWAAYSATSLFVSSGLGPSRIQRYLISGTMSTILLAFWALFAIQRSPWTFYLYIAFPCYFWHDVLRKVVPFSPEYRFQWKRKKAELKWSIPLWHMDLSRVRKHLYTILFGFVGLQSMVAAYTYRPIWSVGFVLLGLAWPFLCWPKQFIKEEPVPLMKWVTICLLTALFPLRNVEQRESLMTILAGGFVIILAGTSGVYVLSKGDAAASSLWNTTKTQFLLTGFSMLVASDSVVRLQAKSGLPLVNQALGWLLLVISSTFPMFMNFRRMSPDARLLVLFMTFAPCFVILSISAEGLFYAAYCATLVTWIEVETKLRSVTLKPRDQPYSPSTEDVRIALFFLFFVQVAFFGTGNVASVSSFYLEPVYRLVPIFNPFIMASLLIFKIIAPYVMLAAAFATLNNRLELPPFSLFLIALSLTDVMTITFFFRVTDTGSWLEIGQTISFFIIASLLLVWSAGICVLGDWLMKNPMPPVIRMKVE